MIEVNLIPNLPQIPYRYGIGQYEGIVMHSTAVYGDTSLGERNYECSHYENAFVHGFSDPHSTIETASTDYIAYGAGPTANQRYLHLELCQVKNDGSQAATEAFKASYGNWIDYAAQRLYDRKLGVITAKPDGTGTLWQHYQVSQYLGGSTHIDPMDYLKTWLITWDQVVLDVTNKYKELEQMDELLKRVCELEDKVKVLENTAAPDWFVIEFGSDALNGIVNEPVGDENFWRNVAVSIRLNKKVTV
jgi:N-acetylmuramoyl-L-alanine amidase CwlA